jgi:hypothetical protein
MAGGGQEMLMPKMIDLASWIFPFFGVALVLGGAHVLYITAGSLAGCTFRSLVANLWARVDEARKLRKIDRTLVARLHDLGD